MNGNVRLVSNKGDWDASNNAPAISNLTQNNSAGDYYVTSVAGTSSFTSRGKGQYFAIGDIVVFNGTVWQKYDQFSVEAGFGTPTNWFEAYNNYIASGAYSSGNNRVTLTQRDSGTITFDLTGNATEAYVTTAINNLIDSAPTALDTLNELAAALGDDASFSSTVTTALGNRLRIDVNNQGLTSTQKTNAQTNMGVDPAGTDNSTDVTLAGTPDYITISGQQITRNQIDLTADVTGVLPSANLDSDTAHLSGSQTFSGAKTFSSTLSAAGYAGSDGTRIMSLDFSSPNPNLVIADQSSGNIAPSANTRTILSIAGTDNFLQLNRNVNGESNAQNGNVMLGATQSFNAIYSREEDNTDKDLHLITGTSSRIVIQSDGNVGIGTTSPDFSLDIEANGSGVQLQLGRTGSNVGSAWMGADSTGFHLGVGAYGSGNSVSDPNGLTISSGGNFGIGDSAFNYYANKLVVKASNEDGVTFLSDSTTAKFRLCFADGTIDHTQELAGYISFDHNLNQMALGGNAGYDHVLIANNGDVTVSDGDLIIGTSGHGIDFSANSTSGGGSDSAILDDYEEGDWTPTYHTTGGSLSATYDSFTGGRYTKVGNQVTCWVKLMTDSFSGGSGLVQIDGLPFTCANINIDGIVSYAYNFGGDFPSAIAYATSTRVYLVYRDSSDGQSVELAASDLADGADKNMMWGVFTYQTAT